ncbi:MAG: TIGR04076 family protein [Actinobacteria bacterium]|jgi:uncharacterized repeat protein (TIGR04076 family)|nr:TIGR04076 family protein [Actinomycetota bacterium]
MSAAPRPAIEPGARRLRVVVERADQPACGIAVGDWFEIDGSRLRTPNGPFCPYAIAAVIPVLPLRQVDLPADDWLIRKPYICCPDARENVVMRIVAEPDR